MNEKLINRLKKLIVESRNLHDQLESIYRQSNKVHYELVEIYSAILSDTSITN